MDSIFLQIVLQIPTIGLLIFAGLLFRGLQREKVNLEDSRMLLENRLSDLRTTEVSDTVKRLDAKLKKLTAEMESMKATIGSRSKDHDRVKDYMDNQKTALKEFGRVLSRTSEQTYSELQQIDDKIISLREALAEQGLNIPSVAA